MNPELIIPVQLDQDLLITSQVLEFQAGSHTYLTLMRVLGI